MNKKLIAVMGLSMALLTGCGLSTLNFEKKEHNIEDIEEVLESRLEAENPRYDLDVTITEDAD